MTDHDSVKEGVTDAWDFWLSQHDYSVPATIREAVQHAMTDWLNQHGEDVFREAVAEAVRDHLPLECGCADSHTPTAT